jgi:hypothetical protein
VCVREKERDQDTEIFPLGIPLDTFIPSEGSEVLGQLDQEWTKERTYLK